MRIRVKRTGVEWEVDEKSTTGARVKEQPDDYEEVKPEKKPEKGG